MNTFVLLVNPKNASFLRSNIFCVTNIYKILIILKFYVKLQKRVQALKSNNKIVITFLLIRQLIYNKKSSELSEMKNQM